MNYRHIYIQIIRRAKNEQMSGLRPASYSFRKRKICLDYYEFHHILPKSLFPQYARLRKNKVALTAREHFICHKLLYKIYPGRQMAYAMRQLCGVYRANELCNISSREYECIQKLASEYISETLKGHTFSEESRQKISSTLKAKYAAGLIEIPHREVTDESRKKISDTLKSKYEAGMVNWNKGKKCPQLAKFQENNPMYGKHHYTNGVQHVVALECPQGFRPGHNNKIDAETEKVRRSKISAASKGKHWYNNGIKNKFCYECPDGYVAGFLDPRWLNRK